MGLFVGVKVHLCCLLQFFVSLVFQLSPSHLLLRLILILLLEEGRLFRVDSDLLFFMLALELLLGLATLARIAFKDVQVAKVLPLYRLILPLALPFMLCHSLKLSLGWLGPVLSLHATHL